MDVFGALTMKLYGAIHQSKQDAGWQDFDGEKEAVSLRHSRPSDRQANFYSLDHHTRPDRTAWGSYTETAPPVLPANASVSGFEDEVLCIAKRIHESIDDNDIDDGLSEQESDCENQEQSGKNRKVGDAHLQAPTRRSRDGHHLLPFSLALPTISHHANSSSLFGSTSRPATTVLRKITRFDDKEGTSIHRSIVSKMATKSHRFITLWFLLTAPIIFWDAGYCFARPRSFKGGDLHWIWKPYGIYQEVDYVYGVEAYNRGDGFPNAQSFLNVIETLLNLYYVYAQHVLASPSAPLVGLVAAVMTLSKTVLYWAVEAFCGGCSIGHNDFKTLILYWIIPNGLWLIFPSLIVYNLGRDIVDGLTTASKVKAAKKD